MKKMAIENELKELAKGFEIPVSQNQFNSIMALRAKKRKQKIFFWSAIASVFLLTSVIGYLLMHPANNMIVQSQNQTNLAHKVQPLNKNNRAEVKTTKSTKNNKPSTLNQDYNNTISTLKIDGLSINKLPKKEKQNMAINTSFNATNKLLKKKVISPNLEINFLGNLYDVSFVENRIAPVLFKRDMYSSWIIPNGLFNNKMNTCFADSIKTPINKNNKFGLFANLVYNPITIAQNAVAQNNYIDAKNVGLDEQARDAFSFTLGIDYSLTDNIKLGTGIGIQQVRFQEIRTLNINRDSLTESIGTTVAADKNWSLPIADLSFTWLDLPIRITYTKNINNKLAWYLQSAIQYQYLIQNKAYVFYPESDKNGSYKTELNPEVSRLNKHQFLLAIEPGLSYSLSNKLALSLGLSYKHQLSSFYNSMYAKTPNANYIGVSVGVNFNI
ncbi:MAG: hypothetical protein KBG11_05895 [Bacteroidia bacterium]|nr:hypothetical protein [Bacteroidia bacterium]